MKKIPKRFFESKRLEISRIIVEELTDWESTTKVTDKEFYQLVDKLATL